LGIATVRENRLPVLNLNEGVQATRIISAADAAIGSATSASAKIVIEVDGDSHAERGEYDAKRTYWINQHGVKVVRFANEEVMTNLDNVLEMIASLCLGGADPSPQPSPRSTGARE
jgi:hypothetical protein